MRYACLAVSWAEPPLAEESAGEGEETGGGGTTALVSVPSPASVLGAVDGGTAGFVPALPGLSFFSGFSGFSGVPDELGASGSGDEAGTEGEGDETDSDGEAEAGEDLGPQSASGGADDGSAASAPGRGVFEVVNQTPAPIKITRIAPNRMSFRGSNASSRDGCQSDR
ncbi:hypothetical protein GCM10027187_13090 [Streptosporangium sandarakinum]